MLTNLSSESSEKYVCELCDYSTSRSSQYKRHLETDKHQNNEKSTFCQQISTNGTTQGSQFVCDCGKIYKERSGLWRHKKKCSDTKDFDSIKEKAKTITDKDELIMFLIKECTDYKNMLMEQQGMMMKVIENGVGNNSHNNNCNNNNKTFNLQVFLNETCKDAMNISEFIDSLQLQLSDLEDVGKLGFVEGISNIIVKNLKALDVHKRPVHCADKKREVIYIKDEDKWEKDNDEKECLRKAIKKVAFKNEKLLPKYKELHPGCNYSHSKYADEYSKIVIETMGGLGNNDIEKQDKIIRNIAKEVVINKN